MNIGGLQLSSDQLFDQACGISFLTLAFCRLFHSLNCRMEKPVLFSKEFFTNHWIFGSFTLSAVLLLLIYYLPGVNGVFMHASPRLRGEGITPYFPNYGIWIAVAFASCVLWIFQFVAWCKVVYSHHIAQRQERRVLANLVIDELNHNAFRLLQILAHHAPLTLAQIDDFMQKANNLYDLNMLMSYEYVVAHTTPSGVTYQLNPDFEKSLVHYPEEIVAITI